MSAMLASSTLSPRPNGTKLLRWTDFLNWLHSLPNVLLNQLPKHVSAVSKPLSIMAVAYTPGGCHACGLRHRRTFRSRAAVASTAVLSEPAKQHVTRTQNSMLAGTSDKSLTRIRPG